MIKAAKDPLRVSNEYVKVRFFKSGLPSHNRRFDGKSSRFDEPGAGKHASVNARYGDVYLELP